MLASMKRLAVSTSHVLACRVRVAVHCSRVASDLARFCQPSIRAHQGRAVEPVGARGDSKGGGAIYAAALGQQPGNISRSPTHRTCERSGARIVRAWSIGLHVHGGSRRRTRTPTALGLEHAAIAQQRIEDAGEATGEGDYGYLFATTRGDAQGPGPQVLRLGRVAAQERDGGLNQEPAGARVAGLRCVSPELRSPGTRPR